MSSKKKRVMAGNDNTKLAKTSSEEERNLFAILNTELFNVILQHLTKDCAKALHMTCRTTNHWVRERLLPLLQHINQFPAARKEGILNQNVLHHISIADFINNIRPILNNYPNIKQGYLDIFDRARQERLTYEQEEALEARHGYQRTQNIISERDKLYEAKRLALQYPELNEREINTIVDIYTHQSLADFLEHTKPLLLRLASLRAEYIEALERQNNNNMQIMQHNPDWHELEEWDRMGEENRINNQKLYALENPNASQQEIEEQIR
jgi:hypothetical protein